MVSPAKWMAFANRYQLSLTAILIRIRQKRLWRAADTVRRNSAFAAQDGRYGHHPHARYVPYAPGLHCDQFSVTIATVELGTPFNSVVIS